MEVGVSEGERKTTKTSKRSCTEQRDMERRRKQDNQKQARKRHAQRIRDGGRKPEYGEQEAKKRKKMKKMKRRTDRLVDEKRR